MVGTMEEWKVWGDPVDPIFTGSEREVRQWVELSPVNHDLYIEGPRGQEEMYENGKWVTAR